MLAELQPGAARLGDLPLRLEPKVVATHERCANDVQDLDQQPECQTEHAPGNVDRQDERSKHDTKHRRHRNQQSLADLARLALEGYPSGSPSGLSGVLLRRLVRRLHCCLLLFLEKLDRLASALGLRYFVGVVWLDGDLVGFVEGLGHVKLALRLLHLRLELGGELLKGAGGRSNGGRVVASVASRRHGERVVPVDELKMRC